MAEPWSTFLTERDREVFAAAGFGAGGELGRRPAIVVVDVTHEFVGDRPEPVLDSVRRFPLSCGEEGWQAMAVLAPVLEAARGAGVPVIYTRSDGDLQLHAASFGRKQQPDQAEVHAHAELNTIPAPIAPQPGDLVIGKAKPSGFFGTSLVQHLVSLGIDQVLCCGTTTSGCVRATVVDAFSYGYRVAVIADCTFDRGQASHALSLFDMGQKYADLLTADDTVAYLKSGVGASG